MVKDPSLCAQILKMVNSSFYGLVQRITSLNQAIVLLGQPTVKSIAASLIMLETVGNMRNVNQYYLQQVWNRSVVCASLISLLCKKEASAFQQKMFLSGLVHDIGHLILSSQFKDKYFSLVVKSEFPDPRFELENIGIEHAETGAALLNSSGFSPEIVELVRLHHSEDQSVHLRKEIDLLEVGDLIADISKWGNSFAEVLGKTSFDTPIAPRRDWSEHLKSKLQAVGSSWEDLQKLEEKIFAPDRLTASKSAG